MPFQKKRPKENKGCVKMFEILLKGYRMRYNSNYLEIHNLKLM